MKKNHKEFIVQKIYTQYTEEYTLLYELKKLDSKTKKPANIFSCVFGSISTMIMGIGMCLILTDIGSTLRIENLMFLGFVIGIIGMIMAIINYPIYKCILNRRRKKFANQIIAICDKIMKN